MYNFTAIWYDQTKEVKRDEISIDKNDIRLATAMAHGLYLSKGKECPGPCVTVVSADGKVDTNV